VNLAGRLFWHNEVLPFAGVSANDCGSPAYPEYSADARAFIGPDPTFPENQVDVQFGKEHVA
jgi:hypothetical protein